ncbi:hypothetical protein FHX42_000791 [Saccharopolyspora lacisalsi]|uniref:Secreted protein n=1 Tax=Halosaccharopolyspora lacisalsi TaxID=1000566 RepID=A0A839DNC2_9PSEU|nr:hypothetical protein [Halosaccharopolyspora lacisalsi]MBA8823462.1 hypothetical protein [Halosaccharopolyspora lacisalsi]
MATSTGVAVALTGEKTQQVAAGSPPPAVEDHSYPGADRIEAETGIRLIEGDGHIVKVDCAKETPLIKVDSSTLGSSCYEVLGESGWLTMEIPKVYALEGDDHNLNAYVTTNGKTQAVDVGPGEYTPVGEGQQPPDNDPATLVELQAS